MQDLPLTHSYFVEPFCTASLQLLLLPRTPWNAALIHPDSPHPLEYPCHLAPSMNLGWSSKLFCGLSCLYPIELPDSFAVLEILVYQETIRDGSSLAWLIDWCLQSQRRLPSCCRASSRERISFAKCWAAQGCQHLSPCEWVCGYFGIRSGFLLMVE